MAVDYPKQRSDISIRAVAGEMVVLDLGGKQIHQLNSTASFIWERCNGQRTVAEIAEELTGAFDLNHEAAREAVEATLRRLDELGLLERARN